MTERQPSTSRHSRTVLVEALERILSMRRWPIVAIVATFALSSYVPLPAHAVLVIVSYLTVYAGAHASLDSKAEEVRALAISGVRASCAGAPMASRRAFPGGMATSAGMAMGSSDSFSIIWDRSHLLAEA